MSLTAINPNHESETTFPVYFLLSLGEKGKRIIAGIISNKLAMMRQGQRESQKRIDLFILKQGK